MLAMLEGLTAANPKLGASFQDWRLQVDDLLVGTVKDDLDTER